MHNLLLMKTYLADIIPKIQQFSQKLDNLTLLTNQHWVVLDELHAAKNIYIFKSNNELLISHNGTVKKGKWEYLGHNSILIDQGDESRLYRHGFFDENILALKVDSMDEYALLVNESRYEGELNSVDRVLDFLSSKYLSPTARRHIEGYVAIENSLRMVDVQLVSKNEKQNEYDDPFSTRKTIRMLSILICFGIFIAWLLGYL